MKNVYKERGLHGPLQKKSISLNALADFVPYSPESIISYDYVSFAERDTTGTALSSAGQSLEQHKPHQLGFCRTWPLCPLVHGCVRPTPVSV